MAKKTKKQKQISSLVDSIGKAKKNIKDQGEVIVEYTEELHGLIGVEGWLEENGEDFYGAQYQLEVSGQSDVRTYKPNANQKILKKLGEKAFLKLAKITFTDLDNALTEKEQKGIVTKSRADGSRTYKYTELE